MGDCRLGMIGAGRWGRNFIRTIDGLAGARLTRIASSNPETADLAPAGCRVDPDWHALIDAGDLHGVIIATPPALHVEMASAAVRARLPVMVEKPLALDLEQAEALGQLVRDCRGYVLVDHTHVFSPAFAALKFAANELGPVMMIDGEAGNMGPYREDATVLWDWGAHDVAMCLDLLQAIPTEVLVRRVDIGRQGGEHVEIILIFPRGVSATINISNIRQDKARRFAVRCRDGELLYDDLAAVKLSLTSYRSSSPPAGEAMRYSDELPLAAAVRRFVDDIEGGKTGDASLQLGIDVVEVLTRCQVELDRSG